MRLRRVVPWLVTALLGSGALAAALAGVAEGPASSTASAAAWAARLVRTTRAAGTAEIVVIPGPASSGTTRWAGVADFRAGDFAVEREPGPALTIDMVGVRRALYFATYVGDTAAGVPRRLPRPAPGPLAIAPSLVSLGPLGYPAGVRRVRRAGPGIVDGVRATRYLVTGPPPGPCGPAAASETAQVWVDRAGRLVQVVSEQAAPAARATTVRFSHFGVRAHVGVPGRRTPVLAGAPPVPRSSPISIAGGGITGGGLAAAFSAGCGGR